MIINFPLLGNAGGGGIDSAATQAMIDASLEGYYTSGETETAIDNKLGDYLSKSEYEPKELAISAALNQLNSDVQTISGNTPDMSLYTPTSGFSTINGSAITEGTNIVIEGGGSGTELLPVSEFPESAETGTLIAKTNQEPSLGYWETDGYYKLFHPNLNALPVEYVNIVELPEIGYNIALGYNQNSDATVYKAYNAEEPDPETTYYMGIVDDSPIGTWIDLETYKMYIVDGALQVGKYEEDMESGEFNPVTNDAETIDFPSGTTIGIYQYDGANWFQYEGGSASGSNIIELTQAEYDALTTKDPDTLYIIADADSINMDNYALQADLTALSGSVSTSLPGKADAANVTANASQTLFPTWNAQGVITGTYRQANDKIMKINGSSFRFYSSEGWNTPPIYAPTEAGDAGKPLIANGTNAAPVYAPYKFAFLTETEYDALTTKETDTIYFVVPDPE